jgi:hypothetical protein
MTIELLDYDPSDTGDIPVGETARIITAAERERLIGEKTENLGQYARPDAPFGFLRKTIQIDDTVTFHSPITPAVGADETVVHTILDSLAGVTVGIDGELEGPQKPPPPLPKPPKGAHELRRSVPYVLPADRREWSYPRHAKPAPAWTKWSIGVGALLVIWAAVILAVVL